jgi:hypothetical protein
MSGNNQVRWGRRSSPQPGRRSPDPGAQRAERPPAACARRSGACCRQGRCTGSARTSSPSCPRCARRAWPRPRPRPAAGPGLPWRRAAPRRRPAGPPQQPRPAGPPTAPAAAPLRRCAQAKPNWNFREDGAAAAAAPAGGWSMRKEPKPAAKAVKKEDGAKPRCGCVARARGVQALRRSPEARRRSSTARGMRALRRAADSASSPARLPAARAARRLRTCCGGRAPPRPPAASCAPRPRRASTRTTTLR